MLARHERKSVCTENACLKSDQCEYQTLKQCETGARFHHSFSGAKLLQCRCPSLTGLQCQVDADWIADNGVFCLGVFLDDFTTALANASKTFNKVVDG